VDYATFQKWQRDLDCEYQTMSWLDCSCDGEGGKKPVNKQMQSLQRVCELNKWHEELQ